MRNEPCLRRVWNGITKTRIFEKLILLGAVITSGSRKFIFWFFCTILSIWKKIWRGMKSLMNCVSFFWRYQSLVYWKLWIVHCVNCLLEKVFCLLLVILFLIYLLMLMTIFWRSTIWSLTQPFWLKKSICYCTYWCVNLKRN